MIKIYNRKTKSYETEKVAGEKYLNWIYSSPIGMGLLEIFLKKKVFSKFYGKYCDSKNSIKKIKPFIDEFNMDMTVSKKKTEDFTSFNDFFYRELTPEARPINKDENSFVAHGDGRLLVYENINLDKVVQVKNLTYSLKELIGYDKISQKYDGGLCLILRLCPLDYHRFHFIDGGTCSHSTHIDGSYYSVNPIALDKIERLFCRNKREWSILSSDNFKDVLYVEVGATCVGSIIQTYTEEKRVEKGEEKGYFKFGGSTVIMFLEKNAVKIDNDILYKSRQNIETIVKMGETIGKKII